MDHTLDAGGPYFSIVDEHADALDFLMPQYYNGGMSPFEPAGLAAIEQNYRALVDGPFGGDASRLVFGYCIEPGCAPVSSQPAALEVTCARPSSPSTNSPTRPRRCVADRASCSTAAAQS